MNLLSTSLQMENELPIEQNKLIHRWSSFNKLLLMVSYLLRFFHNCKVKRDDRLVKPLTPNDLNDSLVRVVSIVQRECFYLEYYQKGAHF